MTQKQLEALILEYRDQIKKEKAAKAAKEAARDALVEWMGQPGSREVKVGKATFTVTLAAVESARVVPEKVKQAFPDTWERDFGEVKTSERLTIK